MRKLLQSAGVGLLSAIFLFYGFAVLSLDKDRVIAEQQPEVLSAKSSRSGITDDFVDQINAIRANSNAKSLIIDQALSKAAEIRAQDMQSRSYYSHTTPDGTNFVDVLKTNGSYQKGFYCENLNMQTGKITDAISSWQSSGPHNDCMTDTKAESVGYGYVQLEDVVYGEEMIKTNIVVAIFGE